MPSHDAIAHRTWEVDNTEWLHNSYPLSCSLGHLYTMQLSGGVWNVALLCLLVCSTSQISAFPTEMQSDDWSASWFLTSSVNDYLKPYTGPVLDRVTNSTAWNLLGRAANGVQGAIDFTGGYMHTYYEDHLKHPVENTKQWIKCKTKPLLERLGGIFQKEEENSQAK